jgi:hypothetical protein
VAVPAVVVPLFGSITALACLAPSVAVAAAPPEPPPPVCGPPQPMVAEARAAASAHGTNREFMVFMGPEHASATAKDNRAARTKFDATSYEWP